MLNTKKIMSIVGTVLAGSLALIVLAKMAPTFLGAVADFNGLLNNETTTTGDSTGDSLLPVFSIVIGVVAVLALITWALKGFGVGMGTFTGKGGGGRKWRR